MKVLPFNSETLKEAVEILKKGGVVAHPADTCFGLTADLMNKKAVEKTQLIKGRGYKKPMSIMISVPEQLKIDNYVKLNDFGAFVTHKLFPSPVTLILPKGPMIPPHYFPDMNTVGLRVPLHDKTQDILLSFGGPLVTTSANCSGTALCFSHDEVAKNFKNSEFKPDLVFEGKLKENGKASTVLEIRKDHLHILRKGPLTASQLEAILGVSVKE
ncbi:threonylcarbamoyl-AMP synthase [Candidatus Pacearchaeota archaeon]|nr:threonylcarbamoyl-AMP synthase [Candidatus Pacearchaeota archaeon]